MKKIALLLSAFLFLTLSIQSQVTSTFDSGAEGWHSNGDGDSYWESGAGNPGGCFRVDDDATGNVNRAYAPIHYLGDWSLVTVSDYISADIYLHKIWGDYFTGNYVFKISGPGGSAKAISPAPTPALDSWTNYTINMDDTFWIIESGTWYNILEDVTQLIITMEYIEGDEYCRLDNVYTSFSPNLNPLEPEICFDFEDGAGGWLIENSAGVSVESTGGFPGQYIKIQDAAGVFSTAHPPSYYFGDWSNLDEHNAEIMFDLKISNFTGNYFIPGYSVKISGPGGVATYPWDESFTNAFDQWYSYGFPIEESEWTIVEGDWDQLISYITDVQIPLEFISGTETVGLDNFCFEDIAPKVGFTYDKNEIFSGEDIQFTDLTSAAPQSWYWEFGDGATSTEQNPTHQYTMPGIFSVALSASNFYGIATETKEDIITVYPVDECYKWSDDFDDNSIHPFWTFDNGVWSESGGTIQQTTNYYEPGNYLGGCYAMVGSPEWGDNIAISFDIKSTDNDWIGLVFNIQDEYNMYMFRWNLQNSLRILSKWINGVETILASDNFSYTQNAWHNIEVESVIDELSVRIDGSPVFNETDDTFNSGKVALYCYGNANSYWDNFLCNCKGPRVELRAYLEGAWRFNGGLSTNLAINNCIPYDQPYSAPPWNYSGGEQLYLFAPVVDWVLIDFRDAETAETATAATSLKKMAAVILPDGHIVSSYGNKSLLLNEEVTKNLFVCIYHRNHIPIMSATPVPKNNGVYSYDFTTSSAKAHGGTQKEVMGSGNTYYAMIAGDTNADGTINYADKNLWDSQVGGKGYIQSDTNMDGQGNNKDKNNKYVKNIGTTSQIPD